MRSPLTAESSIDIAISITYTRSIWTQLLVKMEIVNAARELRDVMLVYDMSAKQTDILGKYIAVSVALSIK